MKYYNKLVQDFRDIAHRFITTALFCATKR